MKTSQDPDTNGKKLLRNKLRLRCCSVGTAFIVWLLAGLCGGHRYYLGKVKSALAMLILSTIVSALLISAALSIGNATAQPLGIGYLPAADLLGPVYLIAMLLNGQLENVSFVVPAAAALQGKVGLAGLVVLCLWWLADAFTLPAAVRQYNTRLYEKLVKENQARQALPPKP